MCALSGHMAGLMTVTAKTRGWASQDAVTKVTIDGTLGGLTRVPDSTVTAFHFNKVSDVLSQQDLD